mmetsp:Transcript_5959/g.20175  ORF Transcript_5959/g.20175 Transcript_5959/m.20175 type:complete len:298 (-) Transcript_5959:101-994(-)
MSFVRQRQARSTDASSWTSSEKSNSASLSCSWSKSIRSDPDRIAPCTTDAETFTPHRSLKKRTASLTSAERGSVLSSTCAITCRLSHSREGFSSRPSAGSMPTRSHSSHGAPSRRYRSICARSVASSRRRESRFSRAAWSSNACASVDRACALESRVSSDGGASISFSASSRRCSVDDARSECFGTLPGSGRDGFVLKRRSSIVPENAFCSSSSEQSQRNVPYKQDEPWRYPHVVLCSSCAARWHCLSQKTAERHKPHRIGFSGTLKQCAHDLSNICISSSRSVATSLSRFFQPSAK